MEEKFNVLILAHHWHRVNNKSGEHYLFMFGQVIAHFLSLTLTLEGFPDVSEHQCVNVHIFFIVSFSHILTFNVDTGYIFEQNACPGNLSWCVSHILKTTRFICLKHRRGEFGSTHMRPWFSRGLKLKNCCVRVVDPAALCAILDTNLLFSF